MVWARVRTYGPGFERALFAPQRIQVKSQPGFKSFAKKSSPRPQINILCGLHGDCAAAAQPLAALISVPRFFHRLKLKAVVAAKSCIFGRDHAALKMERNFFQRYPLLVDGRAINGPQNHQWRNGNGRHREQQC